MQTKPARRFVFIFIKTNCNQHHGPSSHLTVQWVSDVATRVAECAQEGWSSLLLLFKRSSGRKARPLPGKQRCLLPFNPISVPSVVSPLLPPIQLSMQLPLRWTAPRRFAWTVFAPALQRLFPGFGGTRAARRADLGLSLAWRETSWTK